LRSRFDPSIELVSVLVRFNPKGKTPRAIRAWDELGRAAVLRSVTRSELGSTGPTGGLPGCAQGRDSAPSWAGEEVLAHDR
jgi:hypothetical protein